ncbi:hypothetical protein GCM10011574_69450 [Microbispora bryophytorum]|uniref:Uncharacterized protein n=1 Tax=Microbispora bryophytorum TaxID=1460882 RepID=A0A8H9LER1_9ACTN|nr:hypothetical protein GCM10011574_69450 [Microbispora bryophytorum]
MENRVVMGTRAAMGSRVVMGSRVIDLALPYDQLTVDLVRRVVLSLAQPFDGPDLVAGQVSGQQPDESLGHPRNPSHVTSHVTVRRRGLRTSLPPASLLARHFLTRESSDTPTPDMRKPRPTTAGATPQTKKGG